MNPVLFDGWIEKRYKVDGLLETNIFWLKTGPRWNQWTPGMIGRRSGSHHYTYRISPGLVEKYGDREFVDAGLKTDSRSDVLWWVDEVTYINPDERLDYFEVTPEVGDDGSLLNQELPAEVANCYAERNDHIALFSGTKQYVIRADEDLKSTAWDQFLLDHAVRANDRCKRLIRHSRNKYEATVYGPRFNYREYPWQTIDYKLFSPAKADDQVPRYVERNGVIVLD